MWVDEFNGGLVWVCDYFTPGGLGDCEGNGGYGTREVCVESAMTSEVVVRLPTELRGELKEPFGEVYTEAEELLADAEGVLVTVGDVVTYHIEAAGREPDVMVVDEMTKRSAVDDSIKAELGEPDVVVENPAATLTREMIEALCEALDAGGPIRILVEGEEDLVALPAICLVPLGGSVVYGQPDEGMVLVRVDEAVRSRIRSIIERMDGDPDQLFSLLAAQD